MQRTVQPHYQLPAQETEQHHSQGKQVRLMSSDHDRAGQVLDSRRAGLEIFLQSLATIEPLPAELLEFLHLQDVRINQDNISSGN